MYNNSYRIIESKTQEIVSLEMVKNYIRIAHDNDDAMINDMIEAAISYAENFIKSSLTVKTIEAVTYNCKVILLPLLPVLKTIEVKIEDKTIEETGYMLGKYSIILATSSKIQKSTVTYIAGYEDSSQIPAPIKQGILIHISQMYDNRGNPGAFSDHINDIYKPYRKMVV
jgi:uncharacterized phiE125 gp8 family phage protein